MNARAESVETTSSHLRRTPLSLGADCLNKMLNFEIHGNPAYSGLEIQVFDDEIHGKGTLVFLSRADSGLTDVYHEPGLLLDRAGYEIGSGLGDWTETTFQPARVEFALDGVDVDLGLTDRSGREVRIRVDDRGGRRRRSAPFLAPMGAAIERPNRMPLVWMNQFDLVRRRGRFEATIDDDPVKTGSLPGAFLHRRRLVKYASDLFVVAVNPSYEGQIESAVLDDVVIESNGHRAELRLDRAFPLGELNGEGGDGNAWRLRVDDTDLIGGTLIAERSGSQVTVSMEVERGWQPSELPPFMRLVTTVVPVFRRWPTTYRWRADIDLDHLRMVSGWERTDIEGASSYQKFTAAG